MPAKKKPTKAWVNAEARAIVKALNRLESWTFPSWTAYYTRRANIERRVRRLSPYLKETANAG